MRITDVSVIHPDTAGKIARKVSKNFPKHPKQGGLLCKVKQTLKGGHDSYRIS
jgi:hypothetical protein